MDDSFDLLEEKVRRAAELVIRLRKDNEEQKAELGKVRKHLEQAEKKLEALEKERGAAAGEVKQLEATNRELRHLREERDEVRQRIAKLVEVLDGLD